MQLTDEDIAAILKLIDESPHDEIEIAMKGVVVRATRRGAAPAAVAPPTVMAAVKPTPPAGQLPAGCVAVQAPVLGTFYRRPEPGKPPFVEPGARVRADDTVCLIEVMKVFTAVKAGHDGIVEALLVDDAALVEHGQALIAIRPSA